MIKHKLLPQLLLFIFSWTSLVVEVVLFKLMILQFGLISSLVVITIAIFGIGLGAISIHLSPKKWLKKNLYLLLFLCSFTAIIPIILFLLQLGYFIYLALICTFFTIIGIVTISIFNESDCNMNTLYFWNLLGAGLGAISVPLLLSFLGATGILYVAILLLAICSLTISAFKFPKLFILPLIISGIIIYYQADITNPIPLYGQSREEFDNKVMLTDWNAYSRIDVATEESNIERALSDQYKGPKTRGHYYSIDARAISSKGKFTFSTIITDLGNLDSLAYDLINFPYYHLKDKHKILIVGSAGGTESIAAQEASSKHKITAVEINSTIINVLKEHFPNTYEKAYETEQVQLHVEDIRTFLENDDTKYDLITLALVRPSRNHYLTPDSEQPFDYQPLYLYTEESFQNYLNHLNDDGIITLLWYSNNTFTKGIVETLISLFDDVEKHIVLIRNWDLTMTMIKKSPFTKHELSEIQDKVEKLNFLVSYPSEHKTDGKKSIEKALANSTKSPLRYVDDRPFYVSDYNWISYKILIYFGIILLAALLASFIAISHLSKKTKLSTYKTFFYFTGLGIGYITIELFFIQKLSLFIGNPIFSTSTVIASLLIFSGLGSLAYKRLKLKISAVFYIILGLCILNFIILSWILNSFISLPLIARLLIAIIITALPGFWMGMPFPYGLQIIHKKKEKLLPLVWTINGFGTLLGTAIIFVISMKFGYSYLMIAGLLAYGTALLVNKLLKK